jgi:uncharacterized membrane protein
MNEAEQKHNDLVFKMIYYDKLIKSRKIKKTFLKKLYNESYDILLMICWVCVGAFITHALITKEKLLITFIGFMICLIFGIILLAKIKVNSEWLTDFEEYLKIEK